MSRAAASGCAPLCELGDIRVVGWSSHFRFRPTHPITQATIYNMKISVLSAALCFAYANAAERHLFRLPGRSDTAARNFRDNDGNRRLMGNPYYGASRNFRDNGDRKLMGNGDRKLSAPPPNAFFERNFRSDGDRSLSQLPQRKLSSGKRVPTCWAKSLNAPRCKTCKDVLQRQSYAETW